MRKYLTLLLGAALIVALGAGPVQAGHTWRWKECRFQTLDGRWGWTIEETKRTIRCLAPKFDISVEMALFVAEHESGFHADTGSGTYCGVYQHDRDSFPSRLGAARSRWPRLTWMQRGCEAARSNVLAAFYLVKTDGWEAHWCRWTAYC